MKVLVSCFKANASNITSSEGAEAVTPFLNSWVTPRAGPAGARIAWFTFMTVPSEVVNAISYWLPAAEVLSRVTDTPDMFAPVSPLTEPVTRSEFPPEPVKASAPLELL